MLRSRLRGSLPVSRWLGGGGSGPSLVQRGTITIGSGATSNTATLAIPADPTRSRLVFCGVSSPAADTADAAACRLTYTNSTTITASVNAVGSGDRIVSFEVHTYPVGAIRSIQRDTNATGTKAISAVGATATVDYLGHTTTSASPGTGEALASARLSSSIQVTIAGAGSNTVGFQVVDWF